MSFRGEVASLISGNPRNTNLDGEANVYIDDFEGAQTNIDIKGFSAWSLSSVPDKYFKGSGVHGAIYGALFGNSLSDFLGAIVDFPLDTPVILGIQDMRWMCRNVMARDKVLFHGHPLAAVAATTETIAEKACELIEVEYEVLPWAIDIEDAIKPDAPILHDHIKFNDKPSNIAGTLEHKKGDIEEGFSKADVIIERDFKTEAVHQGYLETHSCLVSVAADGRATIWSSSQGQFMVRAMTSFLTGIPQSNIRAIPAEIGGGFGGKTIVYLEPLATVLSQKTGRPVKIVMNREDTMRASGPTSGSKSTIKIGATKDGKIVAAQGTYYLQAGAFPGSPIRGAVGCSLAPYDIPNAHTFGYDVVSNRCKVAAYRAPGAPIGAYGVECVLDEIAEALKICPLQLRKINAAKEGTKAVHGPTYPKMGYMETLEAAINHPHYKSPLGKYQGRGVASGFWFNAGGESSAQLNITEDGNVVVTTGHPDIGGSRASIANITAELLGIHHDRVSVLIGDTATIGYSNLTGGSRVLFASAMVVTESAKIVINQLKQNYSISIQSTFLAAHAVPNEYKTKQTEYIDKIVNEWIPLVSNRNLAKYIDVFCEKGFFNLDDTKRIIEAGKKYGLTPKIHVNQFNSFGGIQLCTELDALSVDHLEVLTDKDLIYLKNSRTIPVALPNCSYFLNIPYTPVSYTHLTLPTILLV